MGRSGREKNKDKPGTKKSRGSSWKEDKGIPNFKDQKAEGPRDGEKLKDFIKDSADFAKNCSRHVVGQNQAALVTQQIHGEKSTQVPPAVSEKPGG